MPDMSVISNEAASAARILQGTQDWINIRLGKVTASRVADVIAKTKTGVSASRAQYAAELVVERLTGAAYQQYKNTAMEFGTETEPQARLVYEMMHDVSVDQVGFIPHPHIAMSGCSPDGLVGTDGLIEIKCPTSKTHIETLLSEQIPQKYLTQIQWQLACSDRAWCDYVSYDPRLPGEMQLFVQRVRRDDAIIRELATNVEVFLAEVADTVGRLQAKYALKEVAE
jgi:putative phage-type endonuclease